MVSDVRRMLKGQEGGDGQQRSASVTYVPSVNEYTLTVA